MKKLSIFLGLALLMTFGCDESPTEVERIATFGRQNDLDLTVTGTGLNYAITTPGTGDNARIGDTVRVDYIGFLLGGNVFDTSIEEVAIGAALFDENRVYEPIEFVVGAGRVIAGWDEGMTYLNEGAEATLVIPSALAYGQFGIPPIIDPNTPIAFIVDMVEIRRGP